MTRWAMIVALLYALILVAVTCPVIAFLGYPHGKVTEATGVYLVWPYWVWVAVMVVCQAALLLVPVRFISRRPITRSPLALPIVLSGFLAAILVLAIWFTAWEVAHLQAWRWPVWLGWLPMLAAGVTWIAWAVAFYLVARRQSVEGAVAAQYGTLLSGSILQLLVAVPTHIAARNRDTCCGTAIGLSVMLFAFGPAVFFLFLARWRQLHPPQIRTNVAETECGNEMARWDCADGTPTGKVVDDRHMMSIAPGFRLLTTPWAFVVGILYISAFFMPVILDDKGRLKSGGFAFRAAALQAWSCLAGESDASLWLVSWFANPLLWFGVFFLMLDAPCTAAVMAAFALICGLSCLVAFGASGLLGGYYTWLASMALLLVAGVYLARSQPRARPGQVAPPRAIGLQPPQDC